MEAMKFDSKDHLEQFRCSGAMILYLPLPHFERAKTADIWRGFLRHFELSSAFIHYITVTS